MMAPRAPYCAPAGQASRYAPIFCPGSNVIRFTFSFRRRPHPCYGIPFVDGLWPGDMRKWSLQWYGFLPAFSSSIARQGEGGIVLSAVAEAMAD